MQELHVAARDAGQRFDKFLARYMSGAPKSFFYKMLRKKNIVLNGKKAELGWNMKAILVFPYLLFSLFLVYFFCYSSSGSQSTYASNS